MADGPQVKYDLLSTYLHPDVTMTEAIIPAAAGFTFWRMMCGDGPVPKAIAKLGETIADQLGQGMQSANDWLRAKSTAAIRSTEMRVEIASQQMQAKAEHEAKLLKIRSQEERAAIWHEVQQCRRMRNIENVLNRASEDLKDSPDAEVSDVKVDPDWTTRFLNHAQDVSDEEMQKLWARLLAGEVRKPGSYSLRTLNTVQAMTKEEGETFASICSALWRGIAGNVSWVLLEKEWVHADPSD
jgi:hypothetical protein